MSIQNMDMRTSSLRPLYRGDTRDDTASEVPVPKLGHILRLTDDVGILQHARYQVPDRCHGYCTDDNARALMAMLLARSLLSETEAIDHLTVRFLSFLQHALNDKTGRFRNFMSYDRRWLEAAGSEDSHGRTIWALGQAATLAPTDALRSAVCNLFERAIPELKTFTHARALAFALIGCHAFLSRHDSREVKALAQEMADKLFQSYRENAADDWPWIEDKVTYANAKISHALIASGRALHQPEMIQAGLRSLIWLLEMQTDAQGYFTPVGNKGWYARKGRRARYDQQPIEALSMIEACREAFEVTGDHAWPGQASMCVGWFLGQNVGRAVLYDTTTGACCDGLGTAGPNLNCGAESTLVCFLSLVHYHQVLKENRPG